MSAQAPETFWMAMALLGVFSLYAARSAYRAFVHLRLIQDTPTTRLRSATQGFVELAGVARVFDGDPITAPLTGTPCCWYRYSIEERQGERRSGWRRLESETSAALFMLEDAGAVCAIDPEGATVTPSARAVWYGRERSPWLSPRQGPAFGWALAPYRYTEERIELGAALLALGHLETMGGAAADAPDLPAALRALKADRANLLARYDRNHDGEIDQEEWTRAREEVQAALTRARATAALPSAVDVLRRPPSAGQPFLLAATAEAAWLQRQRRAGFGWLALALAGACLLFWAIQGRLALPG